jgi:streptomycin 6-kinase
VDECRERWGLEVAPPFAGAHVSFVAPVVAADGTSAVLKVNAPGVWENDREADALAHWNGRGAVRLLAYDPERRALLLERCEPGTPLWTVADGEEADTIAADVLRRLWRPAPADHAFRLLADDAAEWAAGFPAAWTKLGRPFEESLVRVAVEAVRDLAGSQGQAVVLHQDFHGGNLLRAEREPWLAIDPQPLVGEREYDAASLLRDRTAELLRAGEPRRRLRHRLERLADALDVDPERTRLWGVVHALAWGVSGIGKLEEDLVACARWLAAI